MSITTSKRLPSCVKRLPCPLNPRRISKPVYSVIITIYNRDITHSIICISSRIDYLHFIEDRIDAPMITASIPAFAMHTFAVHSIKAH